MSYPHGRSGLAACACYVQLTCTRSNLPDTEQCREINRVEPDCGRGISVGFQKASREPVCALDDAPGYELSLDYLRISNDIDCTQQRLNLDPVEALSGDWIDQRPGVQNTTAEGGRAGTRRRGGRGRGDQRDTPRWRWRLSPYSAGPSPGSIRAM